MCECYIIPQHELDAAAVTGGCADSLRPALQGTSFQFPQRRHARKVTTPRSTREEQTHGDATGSLTGPGSVMTDHIRL